MDGGTDNVKTVYPTTNKVCGGLNILNHKNNAPGSFLMKKRYQFTAFNHDMSMDFGLSSF